MANRKLGPVEGDICWFCKMPSDDESWMGLGILKSTRTPCFEGRYILYHECCAVYSCGAEDTPPTGMTDENVVKWYRHGEKAAGIGLKCQLCGKRGATTGCFYGPCQQFYHFTCARARAYQGHLHFSLDGKRLACMEHAPLLPLPHEESFMGMWMEGVGSWNGMLMEQSRESYLPNYQHYQAQFLQRWEPLLNMTPAADLKAMQELAKGSRKNLKGRGGKAKEDPDFRVKGGSASRIRKPGQRRNASSSGGGAAAAAAGGGRPSSSTGAAAVGSKRSRQHKQQPAALTQPQGLVGVPGDVAAAAERGQGFGGGYPTTTSRSSFLEEAPSGELFSPNSARSRQQQFPGQQDYFVQQQQDQQQYYQQQQQQRQQRRASWQDTDPGARGYDALMGEGGGLGNGGKDALRQLLRQAGDDLQDQPGGPSAGNAVAGNAAPVKPELNCQLLLAAAGFDTAADAAQDWPGQRASSAGQYLNQQQGDWGAGQQQQRQPGSMLAAAGPGFRSNQGPQNALAANAAGLSSLIDELAGRLGASTAAAAGGGAAGAAGTGRAGLGRSFSGASSADSAPNGHQPGQLRQRNAAGNEQQQKLNALSGPGIGTGQFRYATGVLVGPGGPEEPSKQRKLLDLNILARTGRKQLSLGVVKFEAPQLQQASPLPQQQQQQQTVTQQQQQQQAPAAAPLSMTDAEMLQRIAAAMKAVTEAEGPDQAEALATAAAMIAAAAASQAQEAQRPVAAAAGGMGGGMAGRPPASPPVPVASMALGQQQQQQQGPGLQLPGGSGQVSGFQGGRGVPGVKQEPQGDIQYEVLDLLRMQFGPR